MLELCTHLNFDQAVTMLHDHMDRSIAEGWMFAAIHHSTSWKALDDRVHDRVLHEVIVTKHETNTRDVLHLGESHPLTPDLVLDRLNRLEPRGWGKGLPIGSEDPAEGRRDFSESVVVHRTQPLDQLKILVRDLLSGA